MTLPTASGALVILSAISGLAGTLLLFKGSFAFEQFPYYTNPEMIKQVSARNRRRAAFQRTGLSLLACSFILELISAFFN